MKPLFDPTGIIFIKDGHEYYVDVDGTTIKPPSLSTVLRKSGLAPEYGDDIPRWVLDRAAARGDSVHASVHNVLEGRPPSEDHPDYVERAKSLIRKYDIVSTYTEVPLYNPVFDYCCTPDVVGTVRGRNAIVDWKTTQIIHWQAGFQLVGQALCFRKPEEFDLYIGDLRRGTLQPFDSKKYMTLARTAFQLYNDVDDLGKELR